MPIHLTGYRITETLFNNDRTAIHRAIREKDEQQVILKQLVASFPSPGQLSRFSFSYEVLCKFDHPNIVKPLAWYSPSESSIPTMVLEDDHGIDLFAYLDRFQPKVLPVDIFLNIAIQLAEALSVIHYNQVIHKDLHPGNVLVNPFNNHAQITDFGLASLLSREQPSLDAPEQLEGVLAYISPEQTGRMNRALDYRTDLYTLGATFYHLLSGKPPFSADDALGMVHSHIAKQQIPLHEVRSDVPVMLSAIVDKLLMKTAEDRYQSALGLKKDLEKIRFAVSSNKDVPEFPLGMEDISDRFQVPQKLYGREDDVKLLMRRFFQAAGGKPKMLAVAGYSGIGKSALVHEIHKPIAAYSGLFCSGKFDQFQKNIPYSALQTALKGWIQYTLSYSESRLRDRREELIKALGSNARVLIDFLPDFKLVLGDLPPIADLAADETQNRFHLVFQKFIKLITQNRPLVLFIDDIQWADRGTLNLLPVLLSESGTRLLVIVAYRINEVDENHPAMLCLDEIQSSNILEGELCHLDLGPLELSQVSQLIQDALHRPSDEIQSLAELVFSKTAGNPFFTGEFLKSLYTEKLLDFDLAQQKWGWDLERINARDITDNVVELMLSKMKKLPEDTQGLIQLAACVGSRFDLDMLAKIAELPLTIVARKLWPALRDGLLLQDGGEWHLGMVQQDLSHVPIKNESDHVLSQSSLISPQCRFLHDRMLQAAYLSMSLERRKITHLRVGRLLLKHLDKNLNDEECFSIVEQLNKARDLIESQVEKLKLADLNLRAATQAWRASVWASAAEYAEIGLELLPEDAWTNHFETSKQLTSLLAECEYLNGNPHVSDSYYSLLLDNLSDNISKASICANRLIQSIGRGQWKQGIDYGKQGLEFLSMAPPEEGSLNDAVEKELVKLKRLSHDHVIQTEQLPEMVDKRSLIAIKIFPNLSLAAFVLGDNSLISYSNYRGCNLVLEKGKSDLAALQLICYALHLHKQGDLELASQQAEQAKLLADQYVVCREIANVYNLFSCALWYLKAPFQDCIDLAQQGMTFGLENGEIARAIICRCNTLLMEISKGTSLDKVLPLARNAIDLLHKKSIFLPAASVIEKFCSSLLSGDTSAIVSLNDDVFGDHTIQQISSTMHYVHLVHMRSWLAFWYGNEEEALKNSLHVVSMQDKMPLHCFSKDHFFLLGLLLIRNEGGTPEDSLLLDSCFQELEKLSNIYPPNFEHKYLLLLAEKRRIDKAPLEDVFHLYRKSIESARENGFMQFQALASELFADYWFSKNTDEFAEYYLNDAINLYHRWGCSFKVETLKRRAESLYPGHERPVSRRSSIVKSQISDSEKSLDMASVMKSAQAISGELHLKKLISKVLEVIMECAGATYAAITLTQNEEHRVQAVAYHGKPIQLLEDPPLLESHDQLPINILSLVLHSGNPVNIGDVLTEQSFASDRYLIKHQPRSVFCVPVIYRDNVIGALYLENQLTINAFPAERLDVINLLLSQAAISFENAQLFDEVSQLNENLERKVELRTQELNVAVNNLQDANEGLATFSHSVSHDLRAPLRRMAMYSEIVMEDYADKLDDEIKGMLDKINQSSHQMGELISGLLSLSRIQREVVDLQEVDLTKMVNELFAEMRERFPLCQTIAHGEGTHVVMADPRILRSIMENLISNAWKYSSKKSEPKVTFGCLSENEVIPSGIGDVPEKISEGHRIFFVKDNGAGFDMHRAGELFGTFKRLHSSREFEGTGIGLSTVKRAVEKHGGSIWVHAIKDEGATFYFTLQAIQ